jgi:dihydropteroate synthase
MKKTLNIKGQLLDLSTPKVMGILNVTPDSFYEKSRVYGSKKALESTIELMVQNGVDILDVGGYSTRPGASDISIKEEISRVVPAIKKIKSQHKSIIISIDTFRSEVAKAAVAEGATLINDISGGTLDEKMPTVVADLGVPYILMHTRGTPETMQTLTTYKNVVSDVLSELQQRVVLFEEKGVTDIIIDVGFGFAKTVDQNFKLLKSLEYFQLLNLPILAGLSRKSMIWKTLKIGQDDALNGTTALNMIALCKGASVLRVHDIREAKEAIFLYRAIHK